MKIYKVTLCETNKTHSFNSVKYAKLFIEKWCNENNQHAGKIDIDSKTRLWSVGTFQNPIIKFERLTE